jgi:hypothetical protein
VSILLLEGDLLVGLVGVPMTPSWKIVKRLGLLLHGAACEVVLELAISRVEEKLAIRKGLFLRGIGSEKKVSLRGIEKSFMVSPPLQTWRTFLQRKGTREYIFVSACLGYFYPRVYFPL